MLCEHRAFAVAVLVPTLLWQQSLDLSCYRYMESFNAGSSGDTLVLPSNVLEQWFSKFEHKFKRDPDFLIRRGEVA